MISNVTHNASQVNLMMDNQCNQHSFGNKDFGAVQWDVDANFQSAFHQ